MQLIIACPKVKAADLIFKEKSMEKRFVTTPIYYVNDVAHIGHAYTTVIADVLARFYRLQGHDTIFLTGTDEHGQKIAESAKKANKDPQVFVNEVAKTFQDLWDEFEISYDRFIRTTEEDHKKAVKKAFKIMFDKGDIYKGNYEGFYCVSCETFFTQTQLLKDDCCPDCGKATRILSEESYFFRLSKYEDKLLAWYENDEKCIVPKSKKNEIINFVKGGLRDLSITRTSFTWGIPLPEEIQDEKHVIYVWLDALVNYISALDFANNFEKKEYFENAVHVLGKDILKFHAVYWPAFLMSLGISLPKTIAAHGWWTKDGAKMSKSLGNVIKPKEVAEKYGLENFRYFMLREVPFGQDGDYSDQAIKNRINGELCNDLGNLLSRLIGMSSKYFNNEISSNKVEEFFPEEMKEANFHLQESIKNLENFAPNRYLDELFKVLSLANISIAKYEPWNLMKKGENEKCQALLTLLANMLARVALLLSPVMPKTAEKIAQALSFEISTENYNKTLLANEILSLKSQASEPLFARIEDEKIEEAKEVKKVEEKTYISIEDFKKCEIKVGTILACSNIEGSEKLLKFEIDLGEEKTRQIISGIAKFYKAEDLIGQQVCVLANLKPAKIFKHLSEGMILSASFELDKERQLVLLSTFSKVENGAEIG